MPGRKGRKVNRNYRYGGSPAKTTNYMQRRAAGAPKGGNGGKWRRGSLVGAA